MSRFKVVFVFCLFRYYDIYLRWYKYIITCCFVFHYPYINVCRTFCCLVCFLFGRVVSFASGCTNTWAANNKAFNGRFYYMLHMYIYIKIRSWNIKFILRETILFVIVLLCKVRYFNKLDVTNNPWNTIVLFVKHLKRFIMFIMWHFFAVFSRILDPHTPL